VCYDKTVREQLSGPAVGVVARAGVRDLDDHALLPSFLQVRSRRKVIGEGHSDPRRTSGCPCHCARTSGCRGHEFARGTFMMDNTARSFSRAEHYKGSRAKAWCLHIHMQRLSLSLFPRPCMVNWNALPGSRPRDRDRSSPGRAWGRPRRAPRSRGGTLVHFSPQPEHLLWDTLGVV
jgi:hypothetical protein